MIVRVLSALICAILMPALASAAHARAENTVLPIKVSVLGETSAAKPDQAKNTKAPGLVFALATTSDVAIGASAKTSTKSATRTYSKKRYTSKSYRAKKQYARSGGKKKAYASSSKRKARYASGDYGAPRSCLQASARSLLNRIEQRFGTVNLISTCRAGAVIATSGEPSKHRYGLAIDFSVPGRKAAVVQWLLANHHSGGTMTYRDMDHIHVDIGYRFVSLGANSGRG